MRCLIRKVSVAVFIFTFLALAFPLYPTTGMAQSPPTVITNAATNVASNSAILNGNLTNLGGASSADISFEWGVTPSYGNETSSQTMTTTGTFSANLNGILPPGTTYHFQSQGSRRWYVLWI